jgi:hypothetical protein
MTLAITTKSGTVVAFAGLNQSEGDSLTTFLPVSGRNTLADRSGRGGQLELVFGVCLSVRGRVRSDGGCGDTAGVSE